MARSTLPLTATQIKTTKAKEMVEENNLLIVETVKKAQEKSIIDNYSPQEAKTGFTVSEVKVSSKVPTTDQIDYMYSPNKLQNILNFALQLTFAINGFVCPYI